MSESLIERFQFGTRDWPPAFSPGGVLVYGLPRKLDELRSVAQYQIEKLNNAAVQIAKSQREAADVIAQELQKQTENLSSQIVDLEYSVREASSDVVDAVERVGSAICANLSEIRWEIAQTGKTLKGILAVLLHSRSNEARQLMEQGVRLFYVLGSIHEAEERYMLALNFDSTDHQVLRNLGYVHIHKGEPEKAIDYFRRAILLPVELDAPSKASTIDEIARVHYAQKEYEQALSFSLEALSVPGERKAARLYDTGCYAALANMRLRALELLEEAIRLDSVFFTKATVEPDLELMRDSVLDLLSRLAIEAESEARKLLGDALELYKDILDTAYSETHSAAQSLSTCIQKVADVLRKPSYSDYRKCTSVVTKLIRIIEKFPDLRGMYLSLHETQALLTELMSNANLLKEPVKPDVEGFLGKFHMIGFSTAYVITGLMIANIGEHNNFGFWLSKFLLWPLYWVPSLFFALFSIRDAGEFAGAGFIGLVISTFLWIILWWVARGVIEGRLANYEITLQQHQTAVHQKTNLENTINQLYTDSHNFEAQIKADLSSVEM